MLKVSGQANTNKRTKNIILHIKHTVTIKTITEKQTSDKDFISDHHIHIDKIHITTVTVDLGTMVFFLLFFEFS